LLCGLALASGFVYAGVQHFAALKLGYETENLRKVRSQLSEDQRRFVLEREAAASPARLERAARQLGMQPMQAAQIDPLKRTAKSSTEKNPASASTTAAPLAHHAEGKLIRQPKP
jgi:cell division protein FtsL